MQYLLTKEELAELQSRPTTEMLKTAKEAVVALREALLAEAGVQCLSATRPPVAEGSKELREIWYCSECPVGKLYSGGLTGVCNLSKEWSK